MTTTFAKYGSTQDTPKRDNTLKSINPNEEREKKRNKFE